MLRSGCGENLMITLYRKNALGIGTWSIWNEGNIIKIAHSSTLEGSKIHHSETVHEGKQSRTLEQQVQHRIASRVSKQKDKGYIEDVEAAATQLLNQLGFEVPMLAQTYKGQDLSKGEYVQRKLNGLRCLAVNDGGVITMYSRKGKVFEHLHEIRKELLHLIPEGETFDGELYHHGTSLQTIQSWAKRRQTDTLKITYVMYDMMDKVNGFGHRIETLNNAMSDFKEAGHIPQRIAVLATKRIYTQEELDESFVKARKAKFEGLIVKIDGIPYENGKRSKSNLKVKDVFSTEAICTAVTISEKGNPVCEFTWHNGKKFGASPPGGDAEKLHVLQNPSLYIGRPATIEYRELTDDDIPFHAVATNWRED